MFEAVVSVIFFNVYRIINIQTSPRYLSSIRFQIDFLTCIQSFNSSQYPEEKCVGLHEDIMDKFERGACADVQIG